MHQQRQKEISVSSEENHDDFTLVKSRGAKRQLNSTAAHETATPSKITRMKHDIKPCVMLSDKLLLILYIKAVNEDMAKLFHSKPVSL